MMLRNTSEELLIRSLIDGSATATVAAAASAAAAAGIDNVGMGFPGSMRANSEELFNSWIANSENPHHRQHGKMPTELAALLAHQQQANDHAAYQYQTDGKRGASCLENRRTQQDEYPSLQTLSWFQSSQPMTRSRSTELRKRYLEMQRHAAQQGFNFVSAENYQEPVLKPANVPTEHSFLPWPDNLHQQTTDQTSSVSTVVNMLKGTLERKKVTMRNMSLNFMDDHNTDNNNNNVQEGNFMFRVSTPSESSNGAGESSCPATPIHLFHDQQTGRAIICAGNGEPQTEEQQKKQAQLSRAGSITSSGRSGMNTEATSDVSTKKRRVERKRMMVEAKGRSSVPPMPSDMQAAVKRSEALEKEVRSLKLNLSFMNRKDSEQTKRIEELEKQNEELVREKTKLSEELDQMISARTTW